MPTWLILVIAVFLLLPAAVDVVMRRFKKCPQCVKHVRREAKVCRFCGWRFDETRQADEAAVQADK